MKISIYCDTENTEDMSKLAKVASALSDKKKMSSKELDEHIKRVVVEVMTNNPSKA